MKDSMNKIDDILLNAAIDNEIRIVLKKSLHALNEHNYKVMKEIKEQVILERNANNIDDLNWSINVILVPRNDVDKWTKLNFSKLENINHEEEEEHLFLDCPYEDMSKWIGRCYKLNRGILKLVRNNNFVMQERRLFQLANDNKIKSPIIFSPWSRRAVTLIKYDNEYSEIYDGKELEEVLIRDHVLMWNIIDEPVIMEGYCSPDEDEINYQYTFNVEDKAWLLLNKLKGIKDIIRLNNNSVKVLSTDEIPSDGIDRIRQFKVSTNILSDDQFDDQFSNSESRSVFRNICSGVKENRLMTAGDIEYALQVFKYDFGGNKFSCNFHNINTKNEKIITRYEEFDRYRYTNKDMLYYKARRYRPICYVSFTGTDKWLADYANYVLSYLEYHYPEYQWAGVQE